MKNSALSNKRTGVIARFSKIIWTLLILLFAPIVLYYLCTRGFVYFRYKREIYTDYFWYRAPWLLVHVICSIAATLIGPFQFMDVIRRRNPVVHRNLGKLYLGCVLVSTLLSFYLVSTAQLGIVYAVGLTMLGIVWLSSSGMAWYAILKGDVVMHKDWMIKSYVLTLSFVFFRSVEDLLTKMGISSFTERKVLMSWACWAIPFFITVVILQLKKLAVRQKPSI